MPAKSQLRVRRARKIFTSLAARRLALGTALGLLAGSCGAVGFSLAFASPAPELLAVMVLVPTLSGVITASVANARHARKHSYKASFAHSFVHLGSWCGLHTFLQNLGVSRGFVQTLSVSEPQAIAFHQKPVASSQAPEILHPLVTVTTYDSETNSLTADTIGRDQLLSAKLALLSMDHTKQIPH